MSVSVVKAGRKALIGRKLGMTQAHDAEGTVVPVTVLEVGPCTVLGVKSPDGRDGYASLQIGFEETTKRPPRPQQGLFQKAGVKPKKLIREVPVLEASEVSRVPLHSEAGGTVEYSGLEAGSTLLERKVPKRKLILRTVVVPTATEAGSESSESEEAAETEAAETEPAETEAAEAPVTALVVKDSSGKVLKEYPVPHGSSIEVESGETVSDGDLLAYVPRAEDVEEVAPGMQFGVDVFKDIAKVDVSGISKGRGFQGNIKRHGFNAGDKSHGSKNVRQNKATGMGTDPGRVLKGKKMPGQMGNVRRKARALKVVEIDPIENLMLVRGAVPGATGGYVVIQESLKN